MRKIINFLLSFVKISLPTIAILGGLLAISISFNIQLEDKDEPIMVAEIVAIGDKIEVNVIEGEYDASGTYWVITGEDTVYETADGKAISADSLKVGDKIEITYSGQVMMSYPPQIVAKKITKLS